MRRVTGTFEETLWSEPTRESLTGTWKRVLRGVGSRIRDRMTNGE